MAESQVSSGSNIITDNNNYAINISLATWDNRGKQDEHSNNQLWEGFLRCQTDGVTSSLTTHIKRARMCMCPLQIYNNPTTETADV